MPDDLYPEDLSAGDPSLEEILSGVQAPAGLMLAGVGVPQTAAVVGPPELDGVHDPWRDDEDTIGWASPVYRVTWTTGDVIPDPGTPPYWEVIDGADPTWSDYVNSSGSSSLTDDGSLTATDDGAGFLGLIQPTAPVAPSADIRTLMGSDIVIGALYEFPPGSDAVALPGPDGGFFMDVTDPAAPVLYGPKTDGEWGDGTAIGS